MCRGRSQILQVHCLEPPHAHVRVAATAALAILVAPKHHKPLKKYVVLLLYGAARTAATRSTQQSCGQLE